MEAGEFVTMALGCGGTAAVVTIADGTTAGVLGALVGAGCGADEAG